ncbi:hypothetical protein MHU86_16308 [Fragilaria crotonensis]|nr:hypothetical protein MHU86_16308 [Fragilaria crotonensis]
MASMTRPISPTNGDGSQQASWSYNTSSLTRSPTSTMEDTSYSGIENPKLISSVRGATIRAHALLERTLQPARLKTARQAAEEKYQADLKEKRAVKKILYDLKKSNPTAGIVKKLVVEKPLETMATSTRRVDKFAKAMEDPESVAKQKCTLVREMENDAKMRALQMVDFIHEEGSEGFQII